MIAVVVLQHHSHEEVTGHDEVALCAHKDLLFVVDCAAFAHINGAALAEMIAHTRLHFQPNARIERVNLGLHVRHIERLFIGILRIYAVFGGHNMPSVEPFPGMIREVTTAELAIYGRLFLSRYLRIVLKWVAMPVCFLPPTALPNLLMIAVFDFITAPTRRPFLVVPLQSIGHSEGRSAVNNDLTRPSFHLWKAQTGDFYRLSDDRNIAVGVADYAVSAAVFAVIVVSATRNERKSGQCKAEKNRIIFHNAMDFKSQMRSNAYATTFERIPKRIYSKKIYLLL